MPRGLCAQAQRRSSATKLAHGYGLCARRAGAHELRLRRRRGSRAFKGSELLARERELGMNALRVQLLRFEQGLCRVAFGTCLVEVHLLLVHFLADGVELRARSIGRRI